MQKQSIPAKIAAVGLLLLSGSFMIKHFTMMPDFADGLMKGAGIGMIGISLIKQKRLKKEAEV